MMKTWRLSPHQQQQQQQQQLTARREKRCVGTRRAARRARQRGSDSHDVARPRGSWTIRNPSFSAVVSLPLRPSIGTHCAVCARRITMWHSPCQIGQ
eukprot:2365047-Prymnesium_polylepis.1